jgi:hypothetical protein
MYAVVGRGATFTGYFHVLKCHFCPPQFYHLNVIQNEATVCFRTMQSLRAVGKAVWTGKNKEDTNNNVPPSSKTEGVPSAVGTPGPGLGNTGLELDIVAVRGDGVSVGLMLDLLAGWMYVLSLTYHIFTLTCSCIPSHSPPHFRVHGRAT